MFKAKHLDFKLPTEDADDDAQFFGMYVYENTCLSEIF